MSHVWIQRGQVLRSCQAMSLAPLGLDDTALDLLTSMIKYEPDHRITAKDALHHPYFGNAYCAMTGSAHYFCGTDDLPQELKGVAV